MSKNLVIVESPAKAQTIEKYLGSDFKVLASVGHIRKDTKVNEKTFDVTYEIDPDHKKIITDLKKAAKAADKIWLATDEDREGEAISWHLQQVLELPEDTARITFHEITKPALDAAIKSPRTIDMDMVYSQQARQTLDMLVGYELSGIVRKKVPGAISAGRVQSPALRLIVEREQAIEKFNSKNTFKVSGDFDDGKKHDFKATLDKDFESETDAKKFLESISSAKYHVHDIEKTEGTKANPVPLTTAAMQIEANAKLGFSSRTTMSAAQGLYQAGLITYHRTDSLNLSTQAISAIAKYIEQNFGKIIFILAISKLKMPRLKKLTRPFVQLISNRKLPAKTIMSAVYIILFVTARLLRKWLQPKSLKPPFRLKTTKTVISSKPKAKWLSSMVFSKSTAKAKI